MGIHGLDNTCLYCYPLNSVVDAEVFKEERGPVYPLQVSADKSVVMVKCKKRPLIVISRATDTYRESQRRRSIANTGPAKAPRPSP